MKHRLCLSFGKHPHRGTVAHVEWVSEEHLQSASTSTSPLRGVLHHGFSGNIRNPTLKTWAARNPAKHDSSSCAKIPGRQKRMKKLADFYFEVNIQSSNFHLQKNIQDMIFNRPKARVRTAMTPTISKYTFTIPPRLTWNVAHSIRGAWVKRFRLLQGPVRLERAAHRSLYIPFWVHFRHNVP